jgi:hypothetical protein
MAVGRFQVMATLQAARAYELGFPMNSALSWGLNRAIFIAAAKRGFKGKGGPAHSTKGKGVPSSRSRGARREEVETAATFKLGDEIAPGEMRQGKKYFTIGGQTQTEQDFERQVKSRFNDKFDRAWAEALDYVRQFPKETLLSRQRFYEDVYRPRRDELAAKWTEQDQRKIQASPRTK